ncbi:hypothetical protein KIH79_06835 [Bifidobacterium sp. 82T10]|uniref:DUF7694 domain-containing protein n=1 Tax=Bifidobacterium miconis TaxID=2834435 RepID=A0ABS6WF42_9BIFI|nr:hypothetical protein [Bifidobacterium miconis]MBW3092666.1 hypothetical protein [Bifidobacterium miconis]
MTNPTTIIKSRHMKELPVPDGYTALAAINGINAPIRQWQSRDYLAALYHDRNGHTRLSVNRIQRDKRTNEWKDGITWDELQRIKQETLGNVWAVEIYPPEPDLVNIHNIRHLWILPQPPTYAWHNKEQA